MISDKICIYIVTLSLSVLQLGFTGIGQGVDIDPVAGEKNDKMKVLPEVEIITIEDPIVAICKEFKGPYKKSPEYIREVQNMLNQKNIAYQPNKVLGIYFDNPQEKSPDELKSYQGVLVNHSEEMDLPAPYFTYAIQGKYLYTKVSGDPAKSIQKGYKALFAYIRENKLRLSSPAGIQISSAEGDTITTEIYLELE